MNNFFRQLNTPSGRIIVLILVVLIALGGMFIRAEIGRLNAPNVNDEMLEQLQRDLDQN